MLAQIHSVLRHAEQTHDTDREALTSYSVCSIKSKICRSTSACSRQKKNILWIDPHVKDHIISQGLKFSALGGGSPQVDPCRPTSVHVCSYKSFFPSQLVSSLNTQKCGHIFMLVRNRSCPSFIISVLF